MQLKPHKSITAIISAACCMAAVSAGAAEIVLQERATLRSSVVRLCDVAGVAGTESSTVLKLADTALMPAPAPGTVSYLRMAELRDILTARGVELRGISFRGAEFVTIARDELQGHAAFAPSSSQSSAFVPASPEDDVAVAEQLTAAITNYIRQQTGHELWKVQVEADPPVLAAYRQIGSQAGVGGGRAPWSGRQKFTLGGGESTTTIYARVDRMEMALFAVRSIARGDLVRRGDVELRPHGGALPASALLTVDAAVGKEAVQAIRSDSMVAANQVRLPTIVRRNERVSVRARAAGVTARTYAIAQQDGSLGDLVTVQALDGKERYAARVSGLRELEVLAAGVAANDMAAATR